MIEKYKFVPVRDGLMMRTRNLRPILLVNGRWQRYTSDFQISQLIDWNEESLSFKIYNEPGTKITIDSCRTLTGGSAIITVQNRRSGRDLISVNSIDGVMDDTTLT